MIIKEDIYFPFANEDRRLHIYLPDDYYSEGNEERYAVMYMWDGQNLFNDCDATFGKSWGLSNFLQGYWKRMIVVGMECAHNSPQRCNEYCPYSVEIGNVGKLRGDAENTIQWVIEKVKPYIDRRFRTWSHREATAVGGSSMGGMMSLYTILKHNDIFSKAAVISPSIRTSMSHFLNEIKDADINPDTRIFFSWGTNEWNSLEVEETVRNYILELEREIQTKQPSCRTYIFRQEGGLHNEASWELQLPTLFPFLWEG
ncbi:MAG: hypothetical protein MJZ19_09345 [Paludibacteraceae bacterium]|nr:hypothetical protein [Paludibacteraceae bacterium]